MPVSDYLASVRTVDFFGYSLNFFVVSHFPIEGMALSEIIAVSIDAVEGGYSSFTFKGFFSKSSDKRNSVMGLDGFSCLKICDYFSCRRTFNSYCFHTRMFFERSNLC